VPVADLARRARHSRLLADQDALWRVLRPSYRALLRLDSRLGGVTRSVHGEKLRLRYPYSEIDATYEGPVVEAFRAALRPGAVVLDVGAAWGMYGLLAARQFACRVYAFEPVHVNARVIADHARLNGVADRLEVIEAVMDERDGTVELWQQGAGGLVTSSVSEAAARTAEPFYGGELRRREVRALTLDTFCAERGIEPAVVKLDVDGAEARVLRGAARFLAAGRGVLLVEVHPWVLAQLGENEGAVLEPLARAGWTAASVADDGNTRHYVCSTE